MATIYDYENYKRYLQGLNLKPDEYNKKLREWCKKHKF